MSDCTFWQVGPAEGEEAAISGWVDLDMIITVVEIVKDNNKRS